MWLNGLLIVALLAIAKCSEAELTMEAAFQGQCGHGSPCEQLCYELHDGMYECDCTEGYELQKNGYSCQEINSTFSPNSEHDDMLEEADVLYQKGASFSAKLDDSTNENGVNGGNSYNNNNNNNNDNNNIKNNNNNNNDGDDDGAGTSIDTNRLDNINNLDYNSDDDEMSIAMITEIVATPLTQVTLIPNHQIHLQSHDDDFYSKEDMSIYDDVNNNRLNLRNTNRDYISIEEDSYKYGSTTKVPNLRTKITTKSTTERQTTADIITTTSSPVTTTQIINDYSMNTMSPDINYTAPAAAAAAESSREPCHLDCGTEGGYCDYSDTIGGQSRCLCPFSKTGVKCEEDIKINVPRFTRRSWMAFPALRGAYKHVQLHIEFRPESFDGIILLTGERDDLTGDFMALLLYQGFIEFWFDCGSGTGKVRSEETVVLNQWNTVTVYRHRWDAWLLLNQGNRVQGRSKGLFSRITFREPVFLGGTGNITGLTKKLPINDGLIGCIRKFTANEHEYGFTVLPFGDVAQGFDVQECTTDRCSRYPCRHGGKCLPSDQGAICLCPLGFGGDLCEMRLDLQVPAFNGSSYLRYAPIGDRAIIWFELKIIMKPQQEDGLLLYSGHHEYGDYISLCLNMGYVEFTFDLGSGPATVKSEFSLQMGQWHTIRISRTARLAVLKIDQLPEVMTISPNGFWHLSLPHSLFLGGVHNIQTLPLSLREKGSFVGCIQKVEINNQPLAIISEALGGSNVDNCPHACVARPCGPLEQCIPILESYECKCNPSNVLCNRAEEVSVDEVLLRRRKPLNRSYTEVTTIPSTTTTPVTTTKRTTTTPIPTTTRTTTVFSTTANDYYNEDNDDDVDDDDNDDDYDDYKEIEFVDKSNKNNNKFNDNNDDDVDEDVVSPHHQQQKALNTHEKYVTDTLDFATYQHRVVDRQPAVDSVITHSAHAKYMTVDTDQLLKNEKVTKVRAQQKKVTKSYDYDLKKKATTQLLKKASKKHSKAHIPVVVEDNANQREETSIHFLTGGDIVSGIEFMDKIMKSSGGSSGSSIRTSNERSDSDIESTKILKFKQRNHGACFTGTDSFFHYSDAETMRRIISYQIDLNLRFKTHSSHGLILWSGRHTALEDDDFLSLGIENGFLHLRYNLGSGEVNIRYNATRVSDGLWHRVRAVRNLQDGSLEVDGGRPVVQRSPGKLRQLNTDTGLYVGGMPDTGYYTRRRYVTGIVGCISEIILAGELRLNFDSSTLGAAHNVEPGVP